MAFIIDDIAVAAVEAAETAEAVGSVDTVNSVEAISEAPLSTDVKDTSVLNSETKVSKINDTDDVDDMPSSEGENIPKDCPNDTNIFYDEYPGDAPSESTETTELPTNPEVEQQPSTYREFCETRNSGGSYKDIRNEGWGWNDKPPHEVHHMPADSASHLERNDGPAIAMDYNDHQQTASCGSSRDAKEYRAKQQELIQEGKFFEAVQMDIDDIHDKFGDKYDDAISQMLNYVSKIEESKI